MSLVLSKEQLLRCGFRWDSFTESFPLLRRSNQTHIMICSSRVHVLLLFFIMSVASIAWSQPNNDSLLSLHQSGKADASTYNALLWAYVFNQPDSAIFFGKFGERWCRKHKDDSLLASIHNRVGVAYDIKSLPDSALYFYGLALGEARFAGNQKTEGGALNNIGLIYWNLAETDKAIDHYIQSAEIFEEIGNRVGLGNTYNNIALILFEDKQYEKALRYHRMALSARLTAEHAYGIAASYANIGQLYTYTEHVNLDSALFYTQLSIPLKQKLGDNFGLARSYHTAAEIRTSQGDLESAIVYYQLALKLQLQLKNAEGYASTYYNMATAYLNKEDYNQHLAYLDSAQIVAEEYEDFSLLWKVYSQKARSLGRIGRYEEARPYWLSYTHIKDSLVNAEKSAKVEELETRFRTAEQEKELSIKKADLAESKLKVENRTKWLVALLSGLLVVSLLAFGVVQRNKRKAQAEKDSAIITERERGLKAIIDATEDERKRIAKDLHDGIVQTLTGLSLRLQKQVGKATALDENQKIDFKKSQNILDEAIGEVRTISHEMMPRVLNETGLILAIDDMLDKGLGSTDIKYEFEHHRVDGERFEENVEISLYRICQELVNNIIKHSEAKAVSVQLLKTKTHLVLVVEDNGKGFTFDSDENRNGIGLMNISSRAKAMRGEVNYQPSPEQGTVATIRIPLA